MQWKDAVNRITLTALDALTKMIRLKRDVGLMTGMLMYCTICEPFGMQRTPLKQRKIAIRKRSGTAKRQRTNTEKRNRMH